MRLDPSNPTLITIMALKTAVEVHMVTQVKSRILVNNLRLKRYLANQYANRIDIECLSTLVMHSDVHSLSSQPGSRIAI